MSQPTKHWEDRHEQMKHNASIQLELYYTQLIYEVIYVLLLLCKN